MRRITFHWGRTVPAIFLVVMVTGCLLIYGASLWVSRSTAEASVVPTPDFIAAAMRNQALASIDVKFASIGSVAKCHYIRTSDALSMTMAFTDTNDVHKASYDFATRETRTLQTKSDGSNSGTTKTPWLGDPFANLSFHDPVLFVLGWGMEGPRPVYEWIPSGNVRSEKEGIDGHLCWRIDIEQPVEGMAQYSVWADPDIGFCPRRIMMTSVDDDRGPTIVSFLDYRELSPGVWFPMKQVNEYSTISIPKGTRARIDAVGSPDQSSTIPLTLERRTSTYVGSEATADKTFPKDSLLVHFPSGTKLFVNSSTQPVTVP